MEKIDFLATETHFFDHIVPIWKLLPDKYKGTFYVNGTFEDKVIRSGVKYTIGLPTDSKLTLVASYGDYKKTTGKVLFMEHGIGHTYSSKHPAYAGGVGKDRVVLFLNQHALNNYKNLFTYPLVENVIIGTPKMDNVEFEDVEIKDRKPIVCLSFHWDCLVSPESRSAYDFYKVMIPLLAQRDEFKLIMHGHPHIGWQEQFKEYNIEFLTNYADVLKIADIYVNDNSSTMYEFMCTGKPIVVLNCPFYRRGVNHGIRFWEYIGGVQVNRHKELIPAILRTIANPNEFRELRHDIVLKLYPNRGYATQTAVQEIVKFLDELGD